MNIPLPKVVERKLAHVFARFETLIRDFEWTWTKAVLFSLVFSFLVLLTEGIIPSWWLYFAQQKLRWQSLWMVELRDLVAAGFMGTWLIIFFVAPAMLQNMRRKLRGATGDTRPTGGYR